MTGGFAGDGVEPEQQASRFNDSKCEYQDWTQVQSNQEVIES